MGHYESIRTSKGKLAYLFFWNLYRFELGKNRIFARLLGFAPEVSAILVFIKIFDVIPITKTNAIMLVLCGIVMSWVLGVVYSIMGFDKIEAGVSGERNPYITKTYDLVKEMHDNTVKVNNKND